MTTATATIEFKTNPKNWFQVIDITDRIAEFAEKSGVKTCILNIQSLHTTGAIAVNENEPLLLQDIKRYLEKLSPQSAIYEHDNFKVRTVNMCAGECANGHSHCKAVTLQTSVSLNVVGGRLHLGTWQRIFFLELDRGRRRQISLVLLGE